MQNFTISHLDWYNLKYTASLMSAADSATSNELASEFKTSKITKGIARKNKDDRSKKGKPN